MNGTIIEIVKGGTGTCGATSYMIQTDDVMPYMALSVNEKTFPKNSPTVGDKVIFDNHFHNAATNVRYYDSI